MVNINNYISNDTCSNETFYEVIGVCNEWVYENSNSIVAEVPTYTILSFFSFCIVFFLEVLLSLFFLNNSDGNELVNQSTRLQ